MNRTHGEICEITTDAVGTTAALALAAGNGRVSVTITNVNGSGTLYVGPADTVSSTNTTYFSGGDLANTESITLTNYTGPIYVEGSVADVDYLLQVIRTGAASD